MLRLLRGDLHIHTCLSPCAENHMTPGSIVTQALNKDLDFIGIADHNSAQNVLAVRSRGVEAGISVLGGLEVTSHEEVHFLCFFDDDSCLREMDRIVSESLPIGESDEALTGEQIVVGPDDEPVGIEEGLLISATSLTVDEVVETVHDLGGLAIAAHVDRQGFSIIGQLGFIPKGLELDAVELSPLYEPAKDLPLPAHVPKVCFSDAHRPEDIGQATTTFLVESASIEEIRRALRNQDGRRVAS